MKRLWKLRTQVVIVLAILLSLIAFLGAYALSEARRYADEADRLLSQSFKAGAALKEVAGLETEATRLVAKYTATGDREYRVVARRLDARVDELLRRVQAMVRNSGALADEVNALASVRKQGNSARFLKSLQVLERRLGDEGSRNVIRIHEVAQDLVKIILVAFVVAIGVTSWLAGILYYSVLHPIERIKDAARRIREGELSCRVEKHLGFVELRALSSEFNAMASRIEELDEMKNEFVATVSHELKTPLTALKEGLALLAEKREALNGRSLTRTIEVCNQSTKRLETLIENLLNHMRMESGFYDYDETEKDIRAVVENAVQGLRPIAERRGQAVKVEMPHCAVTAAFSTEGLRHVVENLLLNAIKYGDSAQPIRLHVRPIEDAPISLVEFSVLNHGKGIHPSELSRVFDRFFRGSNSHGQKGVGLGLNVVKRIIEAHHGDVSAESQNGITKFSFRIPRFGRGASSCSV